MKLSRIQIPLEHIETRILMMRGCRVILDADLAELYGVTTKRLNEQVKRNRERFPEDFMFRLTADEKAQVVANCDHLHRFKYSTVLPSAFTEHGAIMAASVLNTSRAVEVSVFVVRAFVRLRDVLATHKALACKLEELDHKVGTHDKAIRMILDAIKNLMRQPEPPRRTIGFRPVGGSSP